MKQADSLWAILKGAEIMRGNLIGKRAYIINKDSWYCGEWGTVVDFDGECYYIAIANGTDSVPCFYRDEFRIKRQSNK